MRATCKLCPASLSATYRRCYRPNPGHDQVHNGGESLAAREGGAFGREENPKTPVIGALFALRPQKMVESFSAAAAADDHQDEEQRDAT